MQHTKYQILLSVMRNLAAYAAMGMYYKAETETIDEDDNWISGWTPEFTLKEIERVVDVTGSPEHQITKDDILNMTEEQLFNLGFVKWAEDYQRMVPIWAFHMIAEGTELESILGKNVTVGVDEIDKDVRYGCIGYYFDMRSDDEIEEEQEKKNQIEEFEEYLSENANDEVVQKFKEIKGSFS